MLDGEPGAKRHCPLLPLARPRVSRPRALAKPGPRREQSAVDGITAEMVKAEEDLRRYTGRLHRWHLHESERQELVARLQLAGLDSWSCPQAEARSIHSHGTSVSSLTREEQIAGELSDVGIFTPGDSIPGLSGWQSS